MRRRSHRFRATVILVAACAFGASSAWAHQQPPGCSGDDLGLNLSRNSAQIVNGETVRFTVTLWNFDAGACDVDSATVTLTCPAADGTPTGPATDCATGVAFPAGTPPVTLCEVDCIVLVNPGVTSAQAKAEAHGTLHIDPGSDVVAADRLEVISVAVSSCGDGAINAPEETCDPPGLPAGAHGNPCRDTCTVCGDGVVQEWEFCDDGNTIDTDSCPNRCVPWECGDGFVNPGETCDPPGLPAGGNGNICRPTCTVCGDRIVEADEQCDDANGVDTDACRNDCTRSSCGLEVVKTCEVPQPPATFAGQSDPTPSTPTDHCVVQVGPVDCTTEGKPTSLTFRYNGGTCANPDNNNLQNGKFTCTGTIDPTQPILVSSTDLDDIISPGLVSRGGEFTVSAGNFNGQSTFMLTNSGGTETESIHTSCSRVLAVGNVFGSLTLTAFNGNAGGAEVTYIYTVTNTSSSDLTDVMLVDNQLGDVAEGPFTLDAGEVRSFTKTTTLGQTTINTATASSAAGQCESPPASATVTVLTGETGCATGAGGLVLKGGELQWELANGTSNALQIAEITITWPGANGFLDEIKLDGNRISSGPFDPSSADVTVFEGSAGKRAIDPDKSETLRFKFQNEAVTGTYLIEVRFTNDCQVAFP